MTPRQRSLLALLTLVASGVTGWLMFTHLPQGRDLEAYALSLLALLFAVAAFSVLYPLRANLSFRLFCTLAGVMAAFWAIEFVGGVGWYTLDKIARHYQHS